MSRISRGKPGLDGKTQVLGVFGYPVEHSLSPAMHNAALKSLDLNCVYLPFSVRPEDLENALRSLTSLNLRGVNLTIPHKEAALKFMDHLDVSATDVGAVNTVSLNEGRLTGYNTDGTGFWAPLSDMGYSCENAHVVVLGSGGAARSVAFKLVREGAKITLVNRTVSRAEKLSLDLKQRYPECSVQVLGSEDQYLKDAVQQATLLVNTTKVGMYPHHENISPIEIDFLRSNLIVYDLVYNPRETCLLQGAHQRGCQTLNGVRMLVMQGAAAFEIWTGYLPDTEVMEHAILQCLP